MNTVGIFGGTFDPIHIGHLITALSVLEQRKLKKIIFIPSNISPHKVNYKISRASDRLEMVRLSINGFDNFEFSDFEIIKGDISFTVDTINYFKKYYDSLELIIGFDNLTTFDTWHKPEEILSLAKLIVMKRKTDTSKIHNHKYYKKSVFVDTPSIEVSSTEIRERVKNKLPIDYFVTEKVKQYILKNELYTNK